MAGLNMAEVLVYMDDIVFSLTLEQMEERLTRVFDRLAEFGLKVSPNKCQLCCTLVRYLGHVVSKEGAQTDPAKVEAMKTWARPENVRQLRSFVGFASYYSRFIEGFSVIAKPLFQLTGGVRKTTSLTKDSSVNPRAPFGSRWTPECESAFQKLKERLCTAPVLAFADMSSPFILHIDASHDVLGAVLCQEVDQKVRPISYASRSLSRAERNYTAHKLEYLALKWAVTDKFKDYLYSARGTRVFTDTNPLTYILTSAKLDATGHRWLAAPATFDFTIHYKPGHCNQAADALSRRLDPQCVNPENYDQTDTIHVLEARLQGESEERNQTCNKEHVDAISARYLADYVVKQNSVSVFGVFHDNGC